MKGTLKHLSSGEGASAEGSLGAMPERMNPFAAVDAASEARDAAQDVDGNIARTLKKLAEASEGMEGMDSGNAEAMGEEIMKKMVGVTCTIPPAAAYVGVFGFRQLYVGLHASLHPSHISCALADGGI